MSQTGVLKGWKPARRKKCPGDLHPPAPRAVERVVGPQRCAGGGRRIARAGHNRPGHGPHTYLPINIGNLSSQDHTADGAFHLLPFKGCPVGLGEGHVVGDRPFVLQIHLPESRVMPGTGCSVEQLPGLESPCPRPSSPHLHVGVLLGGQVEDAPRVVVQPLQQVVQAEPALAHCRQQQGQHGLQPREAGGWLGPTLLLHGVGGWEKRA